MFLIDPEFRRYVHCDGPLDPVMLQEVWGLLAALGEVEVVADGWGLEHPDELAATPREFSMRVSPPPGQFLTESAGVRGGGQEFWVSGGTSPRVHAALSRLVDHAASWPGVSVFESQGAYLESLRGSGRARHAAGPVPAAPVPAAGSAGSVWSVLVPVMELGLRAVVVLVVLGVLLAGSLAPSAEVFFSWVQAGATVVVTMWASAVVGAVAAAAGVVLLRAARGRRGPALSPPG